MIVLMQRFVEEYSVIGEINDDLISKYNIDKVDMAFAKSCYVISHNMNNRLDNDDESKLNLYIYNSEKDTGFHKFENIRNAFNKWKRNKIISEL